MATFVNADRIYETSITTGTGTYTLDGAATGFQPFSTIGANNQCAYFATDDTNWEVGIGTYLASPARLQRDTILASSNGGSAVNWASGTRKLRCGMPASLAFPRLLSKSVAGSSDVTLTQDEQRRKVLVLTGALTGNISVIVDATVWDWTIYNNTTGSYTLTVKVSGQTGVAVVQGKRTMVYCDGTDVRPGLTDFAAVAQMPAGAMLDYAGTVVPSGYLACDGSNVSRATYADLYAVLMRSSTATVTIASPGVVSWTAHGLSNGDVVKFTTTGALPTGLSTSTTYYVVNKTTDTFQLSATEGGSAINTSGSQSGTHTAVHAPHGDGDGSTTFTLPDSRRRASVGRGGSATATLGARLGATGGAETHALSSGELASHSHDTSSLYSGVVDGYAAPGYVHSVSSGSSGIGIPTSSTGSGTAHNNMPPSLVVSKIIKY